MRRVVSAVAIAAGLSLATAGLGRPGIVTAYAGTDACDAKAKAAKLNFAFKDVDGKSVSLEAFRGKVLLLDFWATWCVPCKAEIPGFVDLQNRYGDAGFQVIGLSVDDPVEKLRPSMAALKINYPVLRVRSSDKILDAFGHVEALPVNVLIGRDGNICRTHKAVTAMDALESAIKTLL